MEDGKVLFEKGEFKAIFKGGNIQLVADTSAAKNTLEFKSEYLVDLVEAIIPGDQKALAAMLKGALGIG